MSALFHNRRPISSRPWFAALAMTIGVSAMAFGAYTAENPDAFTSKTVPATRAPVQPDIARKVELSPASVQPETPTLILNAVRIMAKPTRRQVQKANLANACTQTWRSLAAGPTTQQVREFCLEPGNSAIQRTLSTHPIPATD
jgi:hypothetical protein